MRDLSFANISAAVYFVRFEMGLLLWTSLVITVMYKEILRVNVNVFIERKATEFSFSLCNYFFFPILF